MASDFGFRGLFLLSISILLHTSLASAVCDQASALPDEVDFRGHTLTRNQLYDFAVDHGTVCFKSRLKDSSTPWQRLTLPDVLEGQVTEISADDELLVVRAGGQPSQRMINSLSAPRDFKWETVRGFPFGNGDTVSIPEDAIGWDISFISPKTDLYYLDRLGEHTVGVGCTTLFILLKGGQRITYRDPWLHVDESNQVCGPMRGKLKAVAFSASGSTLFDMDKYGNSFGLRYDFDIAGADRVFIRYSYNDHVSSLGFLNRLLSPRKLPIDEWHQMPSLPSTDGFFTNLISVEKMGLGGRFREFRIEGVQKGHSGYFKLMHDFVPDPARQVPEETWEFVVSDKPILGQIVGETGPNQPKDLDLGEALGQDLVGHSGNLTMQVEDFNGYCSPSSLKVSFGGKESALELKLHSHESLRLSKLNNQSPISFHGAIEIPESVLAKQETLSPAQNDFLKRFLGMARFTKVKLHQSAQGLRIKSSSSLTKKGLDWTLSPQL